MNSLEKDEADRNFDIAVDWLLNSRHTADPDIQDLFWGITDGYVTIDEVYDNEGEATQKARAAREREA